MNEILTAANDAPVGWWLVFVASCAAAVFAGTILVARLALIVRDHFRQAALVIDRAAAYQQNPEGYCALGHFHPTRLDAEWCEAAHGYGDQ